MDSERPGWRRMILHQCMALSRNIRTGICGSSSRVKYSGHWNACHRHQGSPWSGLENEGFGWWVDHGIEPLAAALRKSMSMSPAVLKAIGARGEAWMMRDFSWTRVATDMLGMYRWLLGHLYQPPSPERFGPYHRMHTRFSSSTAIPADLFIDGRDP
jgi:hypothetical protein